MGFVLRIYFIGLIAFVPIEDPDQMRMNVLLVDATKGYFVSDGTLMEEHVPLLVAKAARCSGDCGFPPGATDAQRIADHLYGHGSSPSPTENLRQLQSALGDGGAAWVIDDSELRILPPVAPAAARSRLQIHKNLASSATGRSGLPASQAEVRDFDWVTRLQALSPGIGRFDPDVLAASPTKGLIAGRLVLDQGTIATYRLVTVGDEVVPLSFTLLTETETIIHYDRAAADWVMAEVQIPECSVHLQDRTFSGTGTRTIELAPERCDGRDVVEIAVLNLPHDSFDADPNRATEHHGKHFELYYELADARPPQRLRPVPVVPAERRTTQPSGSPPAPDPASDFLEALGLPRRGIHSRPICPVVQI